MGTSRRVVLRPLPKGGWRRGSFARTASITAAVGRLEVVDHRGRLHEVPLGDGPGQVCRVILGTGQPGENAGPVSAIHFTDVSGRVLVTTSPMWWEPTHVVRFAELANLDVEAQSWHGLHDDRQGFDEATLSLGPDREPTTGLLAYFLAVALFMVFAVMRMPALVTVGVPFGGLGLFVLAGRLLDRRYLASRSPAEARRPNPEVIDG